MRKPLIASCLLFASYQAAWALDPSSGVTTNSLGACQVTVSVDSYVTSIALMQGQNVIGRAGGAIYSPGGVWFPSPPGTFGVAEIETCLGGGITVSSVNQYGGASFASEDKYGFDFTVGGQTYTYALVGVTGTSWTGVDFDPNAAPTPAEALDDYKDDIVETIKNDANRSLHSTISANVHMAQRARHRFAESLRQSSGEAEASTDKNIAFSVSSGTQTNEADLKTSGSFYGQQGDTDGSQRRLVFGDFDIQHDTETGSSTATLTGRMAWEQSPSDQTMLGYFIGGELARSNITDAFNGDQNRVGVTIGGYGVHSLSDQLFVDGFVSFGMGRNNLDIANEVLSLSSDYTTRTATVGATLSGVIQQQGFDIWPEVTFSYGRTWLGNVDFTGRASDLVDSALSLDSGTVTLANGHLDF